MPMGSLLQEVHKNGVVLHGRLSRCMQRPLKICMSCLS